MRIGFALVLVGVLGCTSSGPSSVDNSEPVTPPQPQVEPDPPPPDQVGEVVAPKITVQLTSATLADDCGGGPTTPPQDPTKGAAKQKREKSDEAPAESKSKAKRRCDQSSIQLAITAPAGTEPAELVVKSVVLSLESGEALGNLVTREPSVWADAEGYMPWDEHIEPGQDLSVSYALSQPDWSKVEDRRNNTYTVKAVLSIAGSDQTLEQRVEVAAPTSLPPNVKT